MDGASLISFLITFINILSKTVVYAIFARVILSWMNMGSPMAKRGAFSGFIHDTTEPIITIVRKLPHRIGMIDLSPFIAIILIDIFAQFLIVLLANSL